jgi:hypothetical protein
MPSKTVQDDLLILISHGSGGVGAAEWGAAKFFLKNGYKVGLLDYFSKWNIDKLFWSYQDHNSDAHTVSFNTILTNINFPTEKIVHIGFSLGGYLGLINSNKFYKNFCFYPGILGYLGQQNFDNTTVIIAENDNWCTFNNTFNNTWFAKDCYHGFMIPNKNKDIPVAKYNFPASMSHGQYLNLMPNHTYLTSMYGHTEEIIRLQSNDRYSIVYLNRILESL